MDTFDSVGKPPYISHPPTAYRMFMTIQGVQITLLFSLPQVRLSRKSHGLCSHVAKGQSQNVDLEYSCISANFKNYISWLSFEIL